MSSAALSLSNSVGTITSPAAGTVPAALAVPAISVRLGRHNFMLWGGITGTVLAGANLHGYLDGTTALPDKTIAVGTGEAATTATNPAYYH